jgi:protein-L-isoaspartate(D-aspartate) O-methyltransferase
MTDFAADRRMMVDGQIRTADVTDMRVLNAILDTPRERFVPATSAALSYLDLDLPVGEGAARGRCLLKPMVLAKLLQAAEIEAGDHVLDIGTASGYSAAVLSHLAASVTALEEDKALAKVAAEALAGLANVTPVSGPLTAGWAQSAPYDVIVLEGSTEVVPQALCAQLKDGGRLVCVLGSGPSAKAMLYRRSGEDVGGRPVFDAAAPLLPGFAKVPVFAF